MATLSRDEGPDCFPSIIPLNVGGQRFMTRLSTLQSDPDSMLAAMFSGRQKVDKDKDGYYFIDANGKYFEFILDFLRMKKMPPNSKILEVYEEAKFYNVESFLGELNNHPQIKMIETRKLIKANIKGYQELKEEVIQAAYKQGKHFAAIPIHGNQQDYRVCTSSSNSVVYKWGFEIQDIVTFLKADLKDDGFSIAPSQLKIGGSRNAKLCYLDKEICACCSYSCHVVFEF